MLGIWANDVLDGAELCQLGLGFGIERSRGEDPDTASLQPDCGGATSECEGTASERPELIVSDNGGVRSRGNILGKSPNSVGDLTNGSLGCHHCSEEVWGMKRRGGCGL